MDNREWLSRAARMGTIGVRGFCIYYNSLGGGERLLAVVVVSVIHGCRGEHSTYAIWVDPQRRKVKYVLAGVFYGSS